VSKTLRDLRDRWEKCVANPMATLADMRDLHAAIVRAERRAAFEQCREMAAAKALEYVRYCEYGCAQKISADIAALQPPEEP